MELIGILKVLRRWIWLLIILVIPTPIFIFVSSRNAEPVYNARATIEITTPDLEDVAVFYERNYISDSDLISITINQFIEIAKLSEVKDRTLAELDVDENYALSISSELGSDFVFINTRASTPELSQSIANMHAAQSIGYFGELRAQPLDKSLIYFEEEVNLAKQEVTDAEQALVDFQMENDITSIEAEFDLHNTLLEQLIVGQALREFDAIAAPIIGNNAADSDVDDQTVTTTIDTYRQNLADTAILESTYNELVNNIEIVQGKYDNLLQNYTESELKASFARQAFFIQIIKPASLPKSPVGGVTRPLILGTVGSLVIAVFLIFFLEYVYPSPSRSVDQEQSEQ